jgi:hypothetical protein
VIDPAMLLPHAQGLLKHGVITFLARHPDRYGAACVELFRRADPKTTSWLALGNALAAARTPGFAATVLGGLDVTLTVRVCDRAGAVRDAPTGNVPGCGLWRVPERWPPTRLHRLFRQSDHRSGGIEFLGRHPIVSQRCGREDREVWTCSSVESSDVAPDEARLAWLEGWGCMPSPLAAAARLDVIWACRATTFDGARSRARGSGRCGRSSPRSPARRLEEPWGARASGAQPRVRVVIEDHRTSPWRKRLPDLSAAPAVALPRARAR